MVLQVLTGDTRWSEAGSFHLKLGTSPSEEKTPITRVTGIPSSWSWVAYIHIATSWPRLPVGSRGHFPFSMSVSLSSLELMVARRCFPTDFLALEQKY